MVEEPLVVALEALLLVVGGGAVAGDLGAVPTFQKLQAWKNAARRLQIRTGQFCLRKDSSAFDSSEASVAVVSTATVDKFWARCKPLPIAPELLASYEKHAAARREAKKRAPPFSTQILTLNSLERADSRCYCFLLDSGANALVLLKMESMYGSEWTGSAPLSIQLPLSFLLFFLLCTCTGALLAISALKAACTSSQWPVVEVLAPQRLVDTW